MDNKKYMLDHTDTIQVKGKTLYRIIALKEIVLGKKGFMFAEVEAGDKGGYVESEKNLSHKGNAWVYDDAKVYGNAVVSGDAIVEHKAQVFGNAKAMDNAIISGRAKVYGSAEIKGTSEVAGSASVSGWSIILGRSLLFDNAIVKCKGTYLFDIKIWDNAIIQSIFDYFSFQGFGSAYRETHVFREKDNWKVSCGCFRGTIEQFEKEIKETHKDNKRIKEEYLAMVKLIKIRIKDRQKV